MLNWPPLIGLWGTRIMLTQHYSKIADYFLRKRKGFNVKRKLDALGAPLSKKKFTAPLSGLEDVYFTGGTVSNTANYAKVVNKLREYVAIHFQDQAKVAARTMEELKDPAFVKPVCPIKMYWVDKGQTHETKSKRNRHKGQ